MAPVAFDDARVTRLLASLDTELTTRYDNEGELFAPHGTDCEGRQPTSPYGHYRDSPRSRCFALDLD